jgi:hypothetical protein
MTPPRNTHPGHGIAGLAVAPRPSSENPEGFFFPRMSRRLPVAYHPMAAATEFWSNGWVRRWLGDTFAGEADLFAFLRQRDALYAALVAPHTDGARLRNLAAWFQFVSAVDDHYTSRSAIGASHRTARQVWTATIGIFRSGLPADDNESYGPYGRAVLDLWRRISPDLTEAQRQRLVSSLEAYLRGCTTEVPIRLTDEVLDYETYMSVRQESFGVDFCGLLTEYACGVDMTNLIALPEFIELAVEQMRHHILFNDLVSLRKEYLNGDAMNAVTVVQHHEGLGLQAATDKVGELVDQHETAFISKRDQILAGHHGRSPDTRAYLDGLSYMLGGAQEFQYSSPRYWGDGFVWDGTTSGWVSLTPATLLRP